MIVMKKVETEKVLCNHIFKFNFELLIHQLCLGIKTNTEQVMVLITPLKTDINLDDINGDGVELTTPY
jgi:hypothetical protein